MKKNVVINRLVAELNEKYRNDNGWVYDSNFIKSGALHEELLSHIELFYSGKYFTHAAFEILSHFSIDRVIYSALYLQNTNKFIVELRRANIYSYLTLAVGSQTCKCMQGKTSIPMHRAMVHFAINVLTLSMNNIEEIGDALIDSLNAENCIIKRGDYQAYGSWFMVELYSKVSGKEINKRRSLYPKYGYEPYSIVLDSWDTDEFEEIDTFITLLSNKYLESALIPLTKNNEEEKRYNLEIPHIQLFPYEILTWLKLREKIGLKNPKTFTHPLMNTPIAKMFLDIKEPLPKPKELPFAKELLEKLKEKCPNIEIPEWLDGEEIHTEKTRLI